LKLRRFKPRIPTGVFTRRINQLESFALGKKKKKSLHQRGR